MGELDAAGVEHEPRRLRIEGIRAELRVAQHRMSQVGEVGPNLVGASGKELPRLLAHLSLPTDFPVTAPARSPPIITPDESQIDPVVEAWDGIDDPGGGGLQPA